MTWTRRRFLRASSVALLAGAVPRAIRAAVPTATGFRDLRRNVGIFTARGGTIGWLVSRSGALVVDSQFPDTARECLFGLESYAPLPLDALINTHHHGDHTGGNRVFRDSVRRIVAHERVPDLQREAAARGGTEAAQEYADTLFSDQWVLDLGEETVRTRHYGPAHTGGDCTIHFEKADIVHMGDLVFNRLFPFIDRPGGASVVGWIGVLESVVEEHGPDTLFIHGHGRDGFDVVGSREDLLLQRDFLTAVLEAARAAAVDGRSRDHLATTTALPGFPDHVPPSLRLTLGAALVAAYDELAGP